MFMCVCFIPVSIVYVRLASMYMVRPRKCTAYAFTTHHTYHTQQNKTHTYSRFSTYNLTVDAGTITAYG